MRFVDRKAKFVTSFAPRGLIAEHGTSWMLPRLIGPSNALDLFWTSRRLDAEEAYRIGEERPSGGITTNEGTSSAT